MWGSRVQNHAVRPNVLLGYQHRPCQSVPIIKSCRQQTSQNSAAVLESSMAGGILCQAKGMTLDTGPALSALICTAIILP